jgi:hypothetical protein
MYDRSLHCSLRPAANTAGRVAGWCVFLAGSLGVLLACGDELTPLPAAGGSSAQPVTTGFADAGRLRGEGFEPTPTFDITNPERPVPPRSQLVEGINNLNGTGGTGGAIVVDAGATDAGADAAP